MTDEPKHQGEAGPKGEAHAAGKDSQQDSGDDDVMLEEEESPALSALLKRSLAVPDDDGAQEEAAKDKELLASVQRKLRKRSKGKFYGDGWSTSQSRFNYALIAGVMLVTIVAVYLALGPTGVSLK